MTDCTKIRCQFVNPSNCEMHEEYPDYTKPLPNIFDTYAIKLWLAINYNVYISFSELLDIVNKVGYEHENVLEEIRSRSKLKG